jgi:cytochrome P450
VRILETAFGDGILVSDGEKWRTHRRIMSPTFDRRSIAFYAPAMTEAAEARLPAWDMPGDGGSIDIWAEMMALTRDIILRAMFSADASTLGAGLGRSLREGFKHLSFSLLDIAPLIGPILMKRKLTRIRSGFKVLDAAMRKLIEARGRSVSAPPRDLLDRLIAAAGSATGARMTGEQVRDEVIIIFLAGHDTSALAATYAWYLLSQHPHAEERLHAELASVLGGRTPALRSCLTHAW